MTIMADAFVCGYGRTQLLQFQCLICKTLYFPNRNNTPVCDDCENTKDWTSKIEPYKIDNGRIINILGWIQKTQSADKRLTKNYKKVYELDNYTCQYCGYYPDPVKFIALSIDHVVPFAGGGSNSIENMVVSCIECNMMASDKRFIDFYAKKHFILTMRDRRNMEIYDDSHRPFINERHVQFSLRELYENVEI